MSVEIEIAQERSEIDNVLAFVRDLVISNDEDFKFASDTLKGANRNWKRLEERRTAVTKPILTAKRGVDILFKPALDGLSEIDKVLRSKIGEYTAKKESERIAVMQASAAVFREGGTPTEIIPERPEASGVSVKAVWTWEVLDAAEVPREFCSPDEAKIQASRDWSAYNEQFPPPPIPGIRFFQRQTVRVRS